MQTFLVLQLILKASSYEKTINIAESENKNLQY